MPSVCWSQVEATGLGWVGVVGWKEGSRDPDPGPRGWDRTLEHAVGHVSHTRAFIQALIWPSWVGLGLLMASEGGDSRTGRCDGRGGRAGAGCGQELEEPSEQAE